MGRQENLEIFEDTVHLYNTNEYLRKSIESSMKEEEFYSGEKSIVRDEKRIYEKDARIIISQKRTMEAASYYAYEKKKVCILDNEIKR